MSENKSVVSTALLPGIETSQGTTSTRENFDDEPQLHEESEGGAPVDVSAQADANGDPSTDLVEPRSNDGNNDGPSGTPPDDGGSHRSSGPTQPPCGPLKVQVDAILRSVGPELAQQVKSTDHALRSQLDALHRLVDASLALAARYPAHWEESELYRQLRLILDPVLKDLRDAHAGLTAQLSSIDKSSAQLLAGIAELAERSEERTNDSKAAFRETGRALQESQTLLHRLEHQASEMRGELESICDQLVERGKEDNLRQKEQRELSDVTRSQIDELGSVVKDRLLPEVEAIGKLEQELLLRTAGLSGEIKSELGEVEAHIRSELSSYHRESAQWHSRLRSTIAQSHRKLADAQASLRQSVGGDLHGQVSSLGGHLRSLDEKVVRELGVLLSEQKLAGSGLADSLRKLESLRVQIDALPQQVGSKEMLEELRAVSTAVRTGFDKDLPLALAAKQEKLESAQRDLEKLLASRLSVIDEKFGKLAMPIIDELRNFDKPFQEIIQGVNNVSASLKVSGIGEHSVKASKASHVIAMFVSNIAAVSVAVFLFLFATKKDCIAWPYDRNQSAAHAAEWQESQHAIQKEISANVVSNGKALSDISSVVTSSEQKLQHISKCIEGALKSPSCRCPKSILAPGVTAAPPPVVSCPSCTPSQGATNATNCNCNCFGKQQTPPAETSDVPLRKVDGPTVRSDTQPPALPSAAPKL